MNERVAQAPSTDDALELRTLSGSCWQASNDTVCIPITSKHIAKAPLITTTLQTRIIKKTQALSQIGLAQPQASKYTESQLPATPLITGTEEAAVASWELKA